MSAGRSQKLGIWICSDANETRISRQDRPQVQEEDRNDRQVSPSNLFFLLLGPQKVIEGVNVYTGDMMSTTHVPLG